MSSIDYLAKLAADEREAVWRANDVQASREHLLAAVCYEAQARAIGKSEPPRTIGNKVA